MHLAAAHSSHSCERWLLVGSLVRCRDEFEPLSERIAQSLWQGVNISQDDIKGEGELVHVGADLGHFSRPFKNGNLDVQDGVLQHNISVQLHFVSAKKKTKQTFFFTYPRVGVVKNHEDDENICAPCRPHGRHHPFLPLQEQPPAIGHNEQQLGCLCRRRSEVSLKHHTTTQLACTQYLRRYSVPTNSGVHVCATAVGQGVTVLA